MTTEQKYETAQQEFVAALEVKGFTGAHFTKVCVDWCLENGMRGMSLRDCIKMFSVANNIPQGIAVLEAERELLG